MPKHKHRVRNDFVHEKLSAATQLGERKIPTAMTWPLAELKSAFRQKAEAIDDARQMLLDQYTEGERDDKGKLKPAVVYATNEDGTPKFKLDAKGEPTTEREIAQGKIQLTNAVEYNRELRAQNREFCDIEVPHLSWIQLEGKVPSLEANIVEPLMEFFDGAPTDSPKAAAGKPPAAKKGAGAPAEAAAT